MGKLLFRYGTMGSSKSAHLLMTAYNFEEKGKHPILMKPSIDTRDGSKISSRIPGLEKDCIMIKPEDSIMNLLNTKANSVMKFLGFTEGDPQRLIFENSDGSRTTIDPAFIPDDPKYYEVTKEPILIDEAQFLTEYQVEQLAELADSGHFVICYGLRTAASTRMFEGSKRLFELADTLEELKSMCECGSKTIFNARIREDGTINPNPSSTVDIGGNDKYKSVCRKCFRVKSKVL
jgi:thymidine kinase